ncbi:DUF3368 domain-containing protein [Persicitalea sp.]|uniref:DUF3368 domain-containing protein n=1 Tax=Persicitalea sp. TaxID=3100273 RepID=UPI003593F037
MKIDRLEILEQVYGTVTIPEAVFEELEKGRNKSYYIDLTDLSWIAIKAVKEKKLLTNLAELDVGEAEVIAIASELEARLVIIDEVLGQKIAKQASLKVTGTLGVLIKAKEMGLIDKLGPLVDDLQAQGIWIGDKLKETVLRQVEEYH